MLTPPNTPDAAALLPPGFRFRSATLEDLPAAVEIRRTEETLIEGRPRTTVREIEIYWNEPERNLSEQNWLVVDDSDRIVAVHDTYDYAPFATAEFDAVVHPDFCGLGIGSALLVRAEQYSMERIARVEGPRLALQTTVSSRHTRAHDLFRAHGFNHIRDWRELALDLTHDVRPVVVPEGLRLAPIRRGEDERIVWAASEEAWQDIFGYTPMPFEEFMYYRIESKATFDPGMFIIAWDEHTGEVAGLSQSRVDIAHGPDPMGWVSQLAVRRPWRGRGLGSTLLHASFQAFRERGLKRAGLSVDAGSLTGADRLYERAGMHEVRRDYIFEKVLRDASDAVAEDAAVNERTSAR